MWMVWRCRAGALSNARNALAALGREAVQLVLGCGPELADSRLGWGATGRPGPD